MQSDLGDECFREQDCGPGHACLLQGFDSDGDGWLSGSCAQESPGTVIGNDCESDSDCRNGICANGLCSQLCLEDHDCPQKYECAIIIRGVLEDAAFQGCYPHRR